MQPATWVTRRSVLPDAPFPAKFKWFAPLITPNHLQPTQANYKTHLAGFAKSHAALDL